MPDPRPDPELVAGRSSMEALRADYDDEFAHRWTPYDIARRRVFGPAIAFIGIGSIGVLGMLVLAGGVLIQHLEIALNNEFELIGLALLVFLILVAVVLFALVIAGGASMLQMRRRWLGLYAAYVVTGLCDQPVAMASFLPIRYLGAIVLYRPDVRREFGRPPRPGRRPC